MVSTTHVASLQTSGIDQTARCHLSNRVTRWKAIPKLVSRAGWRNHQSLNLKSRMIYCTNIKQMTDTLETKNIEIL